jgi:predicted dehydrogenase
VGRGYWGKTYVDVLTRLGIPFWVDGREWHARERPSGLIVACSSDAHYEVARRALQAKIPVLVEKPVCMKSRHAQELIAMGGIALAGHTRLYDPTWSTFKASVGIVQSVEAYAGGVNDTNPDAEWNWWTHLAAMCWDLGFDPGRAAFHVTPEKQPLRFIANGMEFRDGPPGALACLVTEFVKAIEKGEPDNEGLRLGLKTIQYVEERRRSR